MREAVRGYLMALRLSASVVTTVLPWEARDEPEPIVRVSAWPLVAGFDRRELVDLQGQLAVITLPESRASLNRAEQYSLN